MKRERTERLHRVKQHFHSLVVFSTSQKFCSFGLISVFISDDYLYLLVDAQSAFFFKFYIIIDAVVSTNTVTVCTTIHAHCTLIDI